MSLIKELHKKKKKKVPFTVHLYEQEMIEFRDICRKNKLTASEVIREFVVREISLQKMIR